jgi:KaiC/GvpD/RAD55 family RecA-like ATPase
MPGKARPRLYFRGGPKKAKPVAKRRKRIPPKARHRISIRDGKLRLQRPGGRPEGAGEFDFQKIRKQIESSLKKTGPEPVKSFGESRVSTGIRGFDAVMQGGFLRNSVNMVAGGSGTGKSILCMQFLVSGIEKFNEPGIYISFEERPEKILRDMRSFNWNLEDKIKKNKLAILYYTPEQVEKVLTTGAGTVRDVVESIGAKRLVIDSITAFLLLHDRELDRRRALLRRQRAIEIFKMRATKHASKIFPMQITDNGITVFPEESVF